LHNLPVSPLISQLASMTHAFIKDNSVFSNTWYQDLNAHTAASAGDLEALIIIASRNLEDVKRKDSNGWTPLHEAARGGHVEVVTWLLQRGLDMVRALSSFCRVALLVLFPLSRYHSQYILNVGTHVE